MNDALQSNFEIRESTGNRIRARINDYNWSKVLTDNKGKKFKEKIDKSVWEKALNNNDVKVYINHESFVTLGEDVSINAENDGVYLEMTLRESEQGVHQAVKNGELHSCSFGFKCLGEDIKDNGSYYERTILDMELYEVSLLSKTAAYNNTEIEARNLIYNKNNNLLKQIEILSLM